MFAALGTKVLAGIMSLSMFLFSSYTGNDPAFSAVSGFANNGYLQISSTLNYAFDYDFTEVFKSGTPITMYYRVELKSANRVLHNKTFYNRATYDAMKGRYQVIQSGMGNSFYTESYDEMRTAMAMISCSLPVERSWGNVNVSIESWLPSVNFKEVDRVVDLMVLWKFRRPSVKTVLNTPVERGFYEGSSRFPVYDPGFVCAHIYQRFDLFE